MFKISPNDETVRESDMFKISPNDETVRESDLISFQIAKVQIELDKKDLEVKQQHLENNMNKQYYMLGFIISLTLINVIWTTILFVK